MLPSVNFHKGGSVESYAQKSTISIHFKPFNSLFVIPSPSVYVDTGPVRALRSPPTSVECVPPHTPLTTSPEAPLS